MRASAETGLICVWILSVVGDLYPKGYTKVKEIIIRFEKIGKEIYFVSLLLLLHLQTVMCHRA